MGASRQNVQHVVNDLLREGFVTTAPNVHHRRASLVLLAAEGRKAFDQAMELKNPWMNRLASDIAVEDIEAMQRVLAILRARLDAEIVGKDVA